MSNAANTSAPTVDTAKVPGRRALRFETIDQVLADADRLIEAERAGKLRRLGNWSLGQTLGHLGTWVEYSYTGAPLSVPFFIKWLLRLQKKKFLYTPMRAGAKIPGVPGGTLATDAMPTDQAVEKFRQAWERLRIEAPTALNPILGRLTHQEWTALSLRHAELHLGFLLPE
jgi:hypothetical protein